MSEPDRARFASTLAALAAAYRAELDEAGYEGYWMALADLPFEAIRGACVVACRTSKFMPAAAELREIVLEESERSEREARIKQRRREYAASIAWGIAQEAQRENWDESRLKSELRRVGEAIGLWLPLPSANLSVEKE